MKHIKRNNAVDLAAEQAAEWVARLSSVNVTASDQEQLQDWIEASPDHLPAFDDAHQTWVDLDFLAIIADTEPDSLPCELRLEIDRSARLAEEGGSDRSRVVGRWWSGVAAALLVGVLATLWMVWLGSPPTTVDESVAASYRTQVGERRELLLADGSLLTLNTDTEVHVALTESQRSVHIEHGEAYFVVARDQNRPFVVTAGDSTVQAIGTEFNVYHRDETTTVTLLEGTVDVTVPAPEAATTGISEIDQPKERRRIHQSQAVTVKSTGIEMVDLAPEVAARAVSWRRGRLYFDGVTLGEMVEELDRYLPGHLVIADESIADFTGGAVIHLDNVESIMAAIEIAWPVTVDRESPTVIVLRRRH